MEIMVGSLNSNNSPISMFFTCTFLYKFINIEPWIVFCKQRNKDLCSIMSVLERQEVFVDMISYRDVMSFCKNWHLFVLFIIIYCLYYIRFKRKCQEKSFKIFPNSFNKLRVFFNFLIISGSCLFLFVF